MNDSSKARIIGAATAILVLVAGWIVYRTVWGQPAASGPKPPNASSQMQQQYSGYGQKRPNGGHTGHSPGGSQ